MGSRDVSRFWQRLAAEHEADLESFGFEKFKRRQALRYFTWSWRLWRAPGSEQLRFLLAHTPPRIWKEAAAAPMDISDAAWEGCSWPARDRRFYMFAVRLLWAYAESHDRGDVLRLPEPTLGAPFPVNWRGRLISQDLANSALEVAAIKTSLQRRRPRSILELGAGYGRTAYALLSLYPDATYTIIDIDPALRISRWYLTQLFPPQRVRFLTPDQAESLAPASFDLALSISSLQEMTAVQIEHYLALFDRVASPGTVFLKQWAEWHNSEDQLSTRFADYPVPRRWQMSFRQRSPVQTRFVQAAWEVPRRTHGPVSDVAPCVS
jgi:putative sugar O-methyltransferase